MIDTLQHEPFCLPRPGEATPRIETYRGERTNDKGHVTSRPVITRCIECGAQNIRG